MPDKGIGTVKGSSRLRCRRSSGHLRRDRFQRPCDPLFGAVQSRRGGTFCRWTRYLRRGCFGGCATGRLIGFFGHFGFLLAHPLTSLGWSRKSLKGMANEPLGGVAIGTAAAIVRANLPGPAARHR